MASVFSIRALGLNMQPNQMGVEDGSLTIAKNVVINRDNVVEPRRGSKIYGNTFGTVSDRAKQLINYKERILRHFASTLQFDDGTGNFQSFSGVIDETQSGLRIKSIESNGNLYFTTASGIMKISARTADDFTTDPGLITSAGVVKAIDASAIVNYNYADQSSFLLQDSAVAYRIVWGYRDLNNNLFLGTPSQRVEVYNPMITLMLQDYMILLGALDNIGKDSSCLIDDNNYVNTLKLEISASASELRTNLIALAAKLDNDIIYAGVFIPAVAAFFTGQVAGMSSDVTITADNAGTVGNVSLNAYIDGINDIDAIILAWNTANPTNTITLTSGIGTQVPNNGESISLTGGTDAISSPGPLYIGSVSITGGVCTVTLSNGDVEDYFESGSNIFLTGFTAASGVLDGAHTIATVTPTTITFNTSASGAVTVDNSATIISNEYRSIAQPPVPQIPAVHSDLVDIQDYLSFIITRLQQEPDAVIPTATSTAYIENLDTTTTATVNLTITIPENINDNYFFQVYRSAVFVADDTAVLSTDVFPNDELQLVYEAYPTSAEKTAGVVQVEDIVPDAFRGANLYTNASTGEGILQANDIPPFAKDINVFKNSVFYANTRTRHRKELTLLGVQSMIDLYNGGTVPKLTISSGDLFHTYDFVLGETEQFKITATNGASLNSSGTASYIEVNSGNDEKQFYFWFKTGTATDPAISGKIGHMILASGTETGIEIAGLLRDAFNIFTDDFAAETVNEDVIVTTTEVGYTTDPDVANSPFSLTVINQGKGEKVAQQIEEIKTVADVSSSLSGKYFRLNNTYDQEQYYVWFKVNTIGVDPAIPGLTGILVNLIENDTAEDVAEKIEAELANFDDSFQVSRNVDELTITNIQFGTSSGASAGDSGFTVTTLSEGALNVLLSGDISPARAVTITANSLSRVMNKNLTGVLYNFYTSGANEVPGKMSLEARGLEVEEFFLSTNNSTTGDSFSPSLAPALTISSISVGDPDTMLITTSTNHGLTNLDYVIISGSDSTPSIDGKHQITYVSANTFRINEYVTNAGTTGGVTKLIEVESSSNEESPNRVYYSKNQQPESVPILNYFDVGTKDKAILRIYPLRDSLFVLKEDGLYRISGETIPFNLALFDSSCIIVAADSVSSLENVIYAWTRQGISSITESGVRTMSRPLDTVIQPLASPNYPGFSTATWGIGYESDNSYTVFTVNNTSDTYATIGYKYNNITNTWTTVNKDFICGVIETTTDKLYVGVGDTNAIEQERKTFTREDYADREYSFEIQNGRYYNNIIQLDSVTNIDPFDVFIQEQTLSIYEFNSLLLKLDLDPGVPSSNYHSTLEQIPGANLREALLELAQKLDDDGLEFTDYEASIGDKTGSITAITAGTTPVITSTAHGLVTGRVVLLSNTNTTPTIDNFYTITVLDTNRFSINASVINPGTAGNFTTQNNNFNDLRVCYNTIINKLNTDDVVSFSNYRQSSLNTKQEILITAVDRVTKRITVAAELDFVVGEFKVYKSIDCEIQYSPNTFGGDVVSLKHMREAQMIFESLAFTRGTISFATDLLPKFESISFNADGNGRFGFTEFGEGFFGGASNSAPIRTYIPRNCQRCRYMVIKFNHRVAREKWALFGLTITGETELSTRAYR